MFTWICPQCGREVPPSYTDCPDCAEKAAKAGVAAPPGQSPGAPPPPPPQAPFSLTGYIPAPPQYPPQQQQTGYPPPQSYPPPQQQAPPAQWPEPAQSSQPTYPPQQAPPPYQQPPPYAQQGYAPPQGYPPQQSYAPQPQYPPQQPQYPPQQAYAPAAPPASYAPPPQPARRSLPTWLMTIIFTLVFGGLVAGIYWMVATTKGGSPSASVESPAAKPGAKLNPYQKYIEISGVRFTADAKKKPVVKFVVVNHSGADIQGLAGNVTIWGRTQKSEEEAAGTFSFKTDVGPFESKDVSAPLNTKLPMVQLPDWQNVSTDIQITAPGS